MIQVWDTVRDNAYSHELLPSVMSLMSDQVQTGNLSSMLCTSCIFWPKPGPFLLNDIVFKSTDGHPSLCPRFSVLQFI